MTSYFHTLEPNRNERLGRTTNFCKFKTKDVLSFCPSSLSPLFFRSVSRCFFEGVSLTIAGSKFPSYRKFVHEKSYHLESRAIAPIKARCPRQTLVNSGTARSGCPIEPPSFCFQPEKWILRRSFRPFVAESRDRPNTLSL